MSGEYKSTAIPSTELREGDKGTEVEVLYRYLRTFGYFPNDDLRQFASWRPAMSFDPDDPQVFDDTMDQAVRLYQRQQGLKVDGWVGPKTLALLSTPRCGFPDIVPTNTANDAPIDGATSDEFRLQGNRWNTQFLTYHFDNFSPDLTQAEIRAAVRAALDRWAAVTPLTFTETAGPSDHRIGFYSGAHGDGSNFDGASGVLAHCFYPPPNGGDIAGDCHFDEAEAWSVNLPPSGIDLQTVALHEFGHGLGLAHSDVATSVMYAHYGGALRELTDDDVAGIQSIYGARFRWASLGGIVHTPVAVNNQDGRIEVFARGADNALWHTWQTAPNNGWSGWNSLGGILTSKIVAGRNADGRLEVFARGADNALWHMWQTTPNGSWSGWNSLGGRIQPDLAVGANEDGRLEVFAKGMDGALWHIWQTAPNNGWSGWNSLGGLVSDITVGSNADGRLEVFVRGTDNALWNIWQTAPNNGWSGWNSLGGILTSGPVIGRNADGRQEVFARGTDGALWHMWQTAPNNGWTGWATLGGQIQLPRVVNNADGRMEVFVRGADNALWHIWQTAPNNGWSGWATLSGQIKDGPITSRNQDGRLEVFAKGMDDALWHTWQSAPNNGWT